MDYLMVPGFSSIRLALLLGTYLDEKSDALRGAACTHAVLFWRASIRALLFFVWSITASVLSRSAADAPIHSHMKSPAKSVVAIQTKADGGRHLTQANEMKQSGLTPKVHCLLARAHAHTHTYTYMHSTHNTQSHKPKRKYNEAHPHSRAYDYTRSKLVCSRLRWPLFGSAAVGPRPCLCWGLGCWHDL